MAPPLSRLGVAALRTTSRIRPRRVHTPQLYRRRPFHYAPTLRADDSNRPDDHAAKAASDNQAKTDPTSTAESKSEADVLPDIAALATREALGALSSDAPFKPAEDLFSFDMTAEEEREAEQFLANPPEDLKEAIERLQRELGAVADGVSRDSQLETETDVINDSKLNEYSRRGLLSMGDEAVDEPFEDEPYQGDDITSLGHGELETHREIREYARIAAWEMPLLAKFAKPFQLPTTERPLRFRYTSYMGEQHPAENKVVLEFCTADLPLQPAERLKLIKLVGARYDPQVDRVKMSCESFDSQAQNKRYLGDLVEKLIATARGQGKDEAAKDSFKDVPVDFRHVKWRQRPQFPEEWKITPERQRLLQQQRQAIASGEQQRIEEGDVVDGVHVIAESYKKAPMANLLSSAQSLNQRLQNSGAGRKQRRPEMRIL